MDQKYVFIWIKTGVKFVGLRPLWHSRRPNHHKEQKTQKQMVVMKNAQDTRQTEDKKYNKSRWQHWKKCKSSDWWSPCCQKEEKKPVRCKNKKERKKDLQKKGRLSSLLSTKEFLLYLFASSWGQQFRACNRIKQYNKQKFPWRHVGKRIEIHLLVTQKKTN